MKIKTKIIASSIAAIMLCTGSLAFAESKDYTDVNKQSPYYDAIMYMTDTGVFTGVSDTEFAPETSLTRGMFVTLLGRVYENLNGSEGAPEKTALQTSFKDVKTSDYYCAAVSWAQARSRASLSPLRALPPVRARVSRTWWSAFCS